MTEDNIIHINKGRRFTTRAKVPRGESEFVGFRCATNRIRQMDEIVASRFFTEIKTRSDILQDAVVMWIDKYYEDNPEAPGMVMWDVSKRDLSRTMRDTDFAQAEKIILRAIREDDRQLLMSLLPALHKIRILFDQEEASPVEKQAIKELIDRVKWEIANGTT